MLKRVFLQRVSFIIWSLELKSAVRWTRSYSFVKPIGNEELIREIERLIGK